MTTNKEIKELLERIRNWMEDHSYQFTGTSGEIYRDISNTLKQLELEEKLNNTYQTFIDGMKESPQEFIDIQNKFFWDLCYEDPQDKNN